MRHTAPPIDRQTAREDLHAAGAYAVEVPEYHHAAAGPAVTLTMCPDCTGALPGGVWTEPAAPLPGEVCEQCGRRLDGPAEPFARILEDWRAGMVA